MRALTAVFLVLGVLDGSTISAQTMRRKAPEATVIDLRCDHLVNPLAIASEEPQLSFRLADRWDGMFDGLWPTDVKVCAYRITASGRMSDGKSMVPFEWVSAKTLSEKTFGIRWGGPKLTARAEVKWRVEAWVTVDKKEFDTPIVSEWARFATGPRTPADWGARWIGGTGMSAAEKDALASGAVTWIWAPESDQAAKAPNAVRNFRAKFQRKKEDGPAARAELVVAVDNSATFFVNGHEVVFHNRWEDFRRIDVARFLVDGENVVAFTVKNNDKSAGVCAYLIEGTANGTTIARPIGANAKVSADAPDNWRAPDFDDEKWADAVSVAKLGDGPWKMPKMTWSGLPVSYLRRSFRLDEVPQSARLDITALGVVEVKINGRPIPLADKVLNVDRPQSPALLPEWTDYRKRVLFDAFDVTALLEKGENVLSIRLGDGWYCGALGWNLERQNFGDLPPRALARLEVVAKDGKSTVVTTDENFRVATGGILSSDLYAGEIYDARKEPVGWDGRGFDDSKWRAPLVEIHPPAIKVEAHAAPCVTVIEHVLPKSVKEPVPGVLVVDMGQNMVGRVRFRTSGPAGTKIVVRHAEILKPDGLGYYDNLRRAAATDEFVLAGTGIETYEPRFTVHGFRYLEIRGWPGSKVSIGIGGSWRTGVDGTDSATALDEFAVVGSVVATAVEEVYEPRGSWGEENRDLYANIRWGIRGNLISVPTDCPQRDERLGWMGDAQIIWPTACRMFDLRAFSHKWLADIRDAQSPEGAYSDVAPRVIDNADGAPAWGDAGIICAYEAYRAYGDEKLVRDHWDSMERWMRWIEEKNPTYLWLERRQNDFGDWVPAGVETPKDVLATAIWARDAQMMAEMARVAGRGIEVERRYANLAQLIAAAFRKAFVKPDGTVGNGSQTSYALAIAFNLLEERERNLAAEKLVADIRARDNHLTTGFVGTPHLMTALSETGHFDVAWDLFRQTTYPSWRYMIEKGATTIWERWNGDTGDPGMNSFNHYAFGSVGEWVDRYVAGIRDIRYSDRGAPVVVFAPNLLPLRPDANAVEVAFGAHLFNGGGEPVQMASEWWPGRAEYVLIVPRGLSAHVSLPCDDPSKVTIAGGTLSNNRALDELAPGQIQELPVVTSAGRVEFRLASGRYQIAITVPE